MGKEIKTNKNTKEAEKNSAVKEVEVKEVKAKEIKAKEIKVKEIEVKKAEVKKDEIKKDEAKKDKTKKDETIKAEAKKAEVKKDETKGATSEEEQKVKKEEEKAKKQFSKKKVIAIIVAMLAIIYVGGIVYFSAHFFIGTVINGKNCAFQTAEKAEQKISPDMETYTIKLVGRENMIEEITGESIDLVTQYDITTAELQKKQNPFLWFMGIFEKSEYTATVSFEYNPQKLEAVVEQLECLKAENSREPSNAKVVYDETTKKFQIQEADFGTVLIQEKLVEAFLNTIREMGDTVDLDKNGCYTEPELTSEASILKKKKKNANKYCKSSITYKFGEEKVVVDGDVIHKWIKIDDEGNAKLIWDKVEKYVTKLAKKYDTKGNSREFVTSYNKKKVTITTGDYGWWMDTASETTELYNAIKKGKKTTRKPIYIQEAAVYGESDIGKSYIEINLTEQHLFMYVDGKLIVESDVVTGKPDGKHNTPDGVYDITYMQRNAILNGPGYSTPVSYWMPFNGDIGLHDATWQSAFGGTRYITNGSHGCVNLPLSVAQTIFENAWTNMPVVCYFLDVEDEDKAEDKDNNKEKKKETTSSEETSLTETESTQEETTTKKEKQTKKKENETKKTRKETTKKQKQTTKKQKQTTTQKNATTTKQNVTTAKQTTTQKTTAKQTTTQSETTTKQETTPTQENETTSQNETTLDVQ